MFGKKSDGPIQLTPSNPKRKEKLVGTHTSE
jgi:hypothetical protein